MSIDSILEALNGWRYFRPKSVTWWAGVALIVLGVFVSDEQAALISAGLGLIGLRDAIYRQDRNVTDLLLTRQLVDRYTADGLPPGVIDPYEPGGSRG